ncbi:MAG: hypothetical protein AMQ74_01661 [Candidatus Methanofastidiosum methylothiophilum]|uniref:Uncharacterized protein n=1 Tax=Candidatus Methanofastidiosum methylothiophilum TaxID=1705564 RepID=A0A150IRG5_9EURY|nr:MAG: hypothetical protein AMQ74_01661 [Candidatus Methanofastidiosum methylthiophilus]
MEKFRADTQNLKKLVGDTFVEGMINKNCWQMPFLEISVVISNNKASFILDLSNIHKFNETNMSFELYRAMINSTEYYMGQCLEALKQVAKPKDRFVYNIEETIATEKVGFHFPLSHINLEFYQGRLFRGNFFEANLSASPINIKISEVERLSLTYSALWVAKEKLIDYYLYYKCLKEQKEGKI